MYTTMNAYTPLCVQSLSLYDCFCTQAYTDTKPLRIGMLVSDPAFPAVPAMQRAVQLAADLLTKRGHQVFYLTPVVCFLLTTFNQKTVFKVC